ncbi:unnamed protein product [Larinioides sclopetarius]|uniref:Uncharacterized protein n=1 Tax=Larinioides sclopetarius TaxID=280406 RepID=A0AAV1YS94_9ARAC
MKNLCTNKDDLAQLAQPIPNVQPLEMDQTFTQDFAK